MAAAAAPQPVAARAAAAEPEDETAMGQAMYGFLRQIAVLPAIWLSGKVDFKQPANLNMLMTVFSCIMCAGLALLQLAMYRVRQKNDNARVQDPGSLQIAADQKAEDGSVSVRSYDTAKLNESKMQFMMSAAMAFGLNWKWQYTQPMVIMSIMQPLQLFDNKAIRAHLLGMDVGPRPWKAANADNPIAQWAEKKKAEAQEKDRLEKAKKAD